MCAWGRFEGIGGREVGAVLLLQCWGEKIAGKTGLLDPRGKQAGGRKKRKNESKGNQKKEGPWRARLVKASTAAPEGGGNGGNGGGFFGERIGPGGRMDF